MGNLDTSCIDQNIAAAATLAVRAAVPEAAGFVHAAVHNGWITLSGEVRSWAHKNGAEVAVSNVPGIAGITNIIELRAPARSSRRRSSDRQYSVERE